MLIAIIKENSVRLKIAAQGTTERKKSMTHHVKKASNDT